VIIDVQELSNNGIVGRFEVIVLLGDDVDFHVVSVLIRLGDEGGAEIRGYQEAAEYVGKAVDVLHDMIEAIQYERDIRTAHLRRERIAAEKTEATERYEKEKGKWTLN
jgi:hypothetical protein